MGGEETAYDDERFQGNYPPGMEFFYWTKARNRILLHALGNRRELFPMLEVGCGTGIVTGYLRSGGLDVTGVELGSPQVDEAVRPHVILAQDALTLDPAIRSRFRSIALFDVIEHIEDAPAFLRTLLAAYPAVERIVITVPARPEVWTNYDDHFGHFRRYVPSTLKDHLTESGLRPTVLRYFFHGLYWAMQASIALGGGKSRRVRFDPPREQPMRSIHGSIALLLAAEARITPGAWRGSSLLTIAERV